MHSSAWAQKIDGVHPTGQIGSWTAEVHCVRAGGLPFKVKRATRPGPIICQARGQVAEATERSQRLSTASQRQVTSKRPQPRVSIL